jgi:hypothetical protein
MAGFDRNPFHGIAGFGFRCCVIYAMRPLRYREAQRLLFAYAKAEMRFPTALFWLVQTSPGLLGEWFQVAF